MTFGTSRAMPGISRRPPPTGLILTMAQSVRYRTAAEFDVVDRLADVAAERNVPMAQLALAASQLSLTDDEVNRLEQPYVPHPVLAHS